MDDSQDFDAESMQHVEALLNRHPTQMIQRMFQQVLESRRNSVASSYTSSNSSLRSRLSISSTFSTSTGFSTSTANSDYPPSIASSSSSRSRVRRHEPRSYPSSMDPAAHKQPLLTPSSETSSPLDLKVEQPFTPTEEDSKSISFQSEKSQSQLGDSFMFCTYCAELNVLKTFKAKSDWKKHEMRMHETGEDWPCPVIGCGRVHDRQKDFIKHHSRYHSGRPLPSVTDIGIRLLSRKVFGCGFEKCKEVSIGWDERCDHVAKHMKNGSTFEQWNYTNVIRNLIRQEALHDTWKELFANLDERLRESRSQITWSPDNTRVLRQKLQCCDLRPSREDVLITALSLRSDLPLDPSQIQIPPGFVTPSRDSVPHVDQISREQRMQVLNGNSNITISRTRLAALEMALLQRMYPDHSYEPYTESPAVDTAERRISYMDLDSNDFLNTPAEVVAPPPLSIQTQQPLIAEQHQSAGFEDPGKPSNPLAWCYPSYFDTPPAFEDSDYYDRTSAGHAIPKPLQKVSGRLDSRTDSPHSRPASQHDLPQFGSDYPVQFSMQQQQQQQQIPHYAHSQPPQSHHHIVQQPPTTHPQQYMSMRQHFRSPTSHSQLHHFTPQG